MCLPDYPCRLNRNKARQTRTAQYAESGKLAEYKRWMDPAVIDKYWKEREAVSTCKKLCMMAPICLCHSSSFTRLST